jgi:sugar/nucleoside kinase (ribokinase family)
MVDRVALRAADRPALVVAGKLVVDEVLHLPGPLTPGSQQRARAREITGGGQVWHTARAAAAAGARVRVTGRCGSDEETAGLRRLLARAGIDDVLVPTGPATRAIVLVEPEGERTIVSTGGDGALPPGAVDAEVVLAGAAWLHLDGYALDPVSGDELLRLAQAAAAGGVPVSLEPPSVGSLSSRAPWLSRLPPLACLLGRPDEVALASSLLGHEPVSTVVHDQGAPVRVRAEGAEEVIPVRPDPPAALGAGDRFTGGVLAARLDGKPWSDSLRLGIDAAHA